MQHIIRESLHEGLKTIAMSNFSSSLEAAAEIIDNSVDERDIEKTLKMKIRIGRGRIVFLDSNSLGMGLAELSDFLKWGFSPKKYSVEKIGKYGAGGKGAIGYLGKKCQIRTKRKGQKVQYEIEEENWRDPALKKFAVKELKSAVEENIGFTQIDILGVDRKLSKPQLAEMVSHIYKPLLEKNLLEVLIGDQSLSRVEAFKIPSDENFPSEKVEETTPFGVITGWIGRLRSKSGVRGGIRCYYRGRLITKDFKKAQEFFGHPDPQSLGSLNYLIGEISLDFAPVLPNKTDFDRDSQEWSVISSIMHDLLKPHIEQLKNRSDGLEVTEDDLNNLPEVRSIVEEARKRVMLKEPYEGKLSVGTDYGRKPPEEGNGIEHRKPVNKVNIRENIPSTPPPLNSIGKLKRTKGIIDYTVKIGDGLTRSAIVDVDSNPRQKTLVIYKDYPEYLARGGDFLYKAESAVLQLERPDESEDQSVSSFLDRVDKVMAEVVKLKEARKKRGKFDFEDLFKTN